MYPNLRWLPIVVSGIIMVGAPALAQQSPPFWGNLHPGPHAVGFRSSWQRDHGRRYNIVFEDRTRYADAKAPRPILVNIWYPAKLADRAAPMLHRDYLAIGSDDPQLSRLAARLVDYERDVVGKEMMGKKPAELSGKERRLLDEFWATPTASHREAPPVDGKFPLDHLPRRSPILLRGQRRPVRIPGQPRLRRPRLTLPDDQWSGLQHRRSGRFGRRPGIPDRVRQPAAGCQLAAHRCGRPQRRSPGDVVLPRASMPRRPMPSLVSTLPRTITASPRTAGTTWSDTSAITLTT